MLPMLEWSMLPMLEWSIPDISPELLISMFP